MSTQPKPTKAVIQWREWIKLIRDGRSRALCAECGYPELIGSDDCRNCGTNFHDGRFDLSTSSQLAAAQATIKLQNDLLLEIGHGGTFISDHEALDAAIAEAQKPLVELLSKCNEWLKQTGNLVTVTPEIDAALAKVKERK